jgi:hypothetical protein
MQSTEDFEVWAISEGLDCTKSETTELGDVNTAPGKYLYATTRVAFRSWIASRAAMPEACEAAPMTSTARQALWDELRNKNEGMCSWGNQEYYLQGLEDAEKHFVKSTTPEY